MSLQITIEQFQSLTLAELIKAGFPNKVVGVEISLRTTNEKPRYRVYLLQDELFELPAPRMLADSIISPFKAIDDLVKALNKIKVDGIEVNAETLN